MQLNVRRLAWILGGLSLLGTTGLAAVACTSNGDDAVAPPAPTTKPTTTSTTAPDGAPTTLPDGALPPEDGGTAPDCGFAPKLRPPFAGDAAAPDATASFFCPFGDGGTAGTDKRFCAGNQTCCSGQAGASGGAFDSTYCTGAKADTCGSGTNGPRVRWECGSKETCGGGEKCCIPGTDAGPPAVDTEKVNGKLCPPEFQRGFYIGGTACRAACQSGELEVCTKDADCVSPKKCVAFSTNSRDMGACK